jgi:hypothetical protein
MASAAVYDSAVRRFTERAVDWESDEFKVLLLRPDYVPQQQSDATRDDVRRFEVDPSGTYERGGLPLQDRVIEQEFGLIRLQAGSVKCERFTGVFRFVVIYQPGGGEWLVAYTDFGDQAARNATVSVSYGAGVCEFEVMPALAETG